MTFKIATLLQAIKRSDDSRTILILKNIIGALGLKGIAMLTSFLIVPVTLHYLDVETYGVWLTLSSILYWISFFDIGLGNGMRNYLTEAISTNEYELARKYISTTFILLTIVAIILAIIVVIAIPFVNMQEVFNTTNSSNEVLVSSFLIAILMTLTLFVVKNIGIIFVAMQLPVLNDLMGVIGNVASLATVCCISIYSEGNLLHIVTAFTIPPVLVFCIAAIPTFNKYRQLRPSFKYLDWHLGRNIISKGTGFFIIQITSCLVIFGASNIFITQYCGPESVTYYGIAYKYFNLLAILYGIILTPFWNAYTDAYVQNNLEWIKKSFRRTIIIWFTLTLFGLILFIIAPWFYRLWIGETVHIHWSLSLVTFAYISMFNLTNCMTFLVNGLNMIRVQLITSIVITVIYLCLIHIMGNNFGLCGIVGCMAICYFIYAMIIFYQDMLIIQGNAQGIWKK